MKVANKTVTVLLNALECKVFWCCFCFFFFLQTLHKLQLSFPALGLSKILDF